jgi:DivIVA domain-containing protein
MRLTPLDIQNHHFRRRLRGYDDAEVDAFIQMLARGWRSSRRRRRRSRRR